MEKPRILIGSVIRRQPEILKEFLMSLSTLDIDGFETEFFFIDDNTDADSSRILKEFAHGTKGEARVMRVNPEGQFACDDETHHWTDAQIRRVGSLKDDILDYADRQGYNVFLVDSDIVLHPWTLQQLWISEREIISEIFWTQWKPGQPYLPQVWMSGQYCLCQKHPGEVLDPSEEAFRTANVLNILRNPGVYEVGGLGACTLIRDSAIRRGVRFRMIPNLGLIGEDRDFCVRAAALGIGLYVDTHYPAYHIYRLSDLPGAYRYRELCRNSLEIALANGLHPRFMERPKSLAERRRVRKDNHSLTLVMVVRNESGRYLERMLRHTSKFIDAAVVIDDASTDDTPEIVRRELRAAGVPLTLHVRETSGFENEVAIRRQAWDLAVATDPDWLLFLDADEIFEDRAAIEIRRLMEDPRWDFYAFRLYDMWDETHYREDKYWQAHLSYTPLMVRYQPEFEYEWLDQPVHCGRVPLNIGALPGTASRLRVKHLGWSSPEDRVRKYEFYMNRDPQGRYGIAQRYQSVLELRPNLVKWEE